MVILDKASSLGLHGCFGEAILRGIQREADMSIKVFVPTPLRVYCGGAAEISVAANNVRGALDQIEQKYPSLYSGVCEETGAVRRHINVFVNSLHMRDLDGLDTPLVPGDVVTILPAVSGG